MEFGVGDFIWIYPHKELSWAVGEIKSVSLNSYFVQAIDNPRDPFYEVPKQSAFPVYASCISGVPDLLSLEEFNEGALLNNVRARYFQNKIYTSVGEPILISVNPYQNLPIYNEEMARSYRAKLNTEPHLFLIAQKAYENLRESSQSIIISGESGSGKTEAAKIILGYLAGTQKEFSSIASKVIDSNPILEAFGNAKTLRNDNSSRFGKFIQIHFDKARLKLQSASIENYLLEKSRIVTQLQGERNYHFFYQLCAGASDQEKAAFKILPPSEYYYLTRGNCLYIEGVDDVENYRTTRQCMDTLNFTQEEQQSVIKTIMGVLYLGNVNFVGEDKAQVQDYLPLRTACELLEVPLEDLEKSLVNRVITDPSTKKEIVMNQNCEQAYSNRDAAAKEIYSRLFDWLITRVNYSISVVHGKETRVIGLLDIYGFEVFEENSFEQLCINYANEKLQQYFNDHIFKQEQNEYSEEKIDWEHITFDDNQGCIDLIEGRPLSILLLLDEHSRLSRKSDKQYLNTIYSKLNHNNYLCSPGPLATSHLGINHYAGTVYYNILGFIEKNSNTLNPLLQLTLGNSSINLLSSVFSKQKNPNTPNTLSTPSLARQFQKQLNELVENLSVSRPWFIRCIKPNKLKKPYEHDSFDVQRQLRCAGMLESIRIRKAGYSIRVSISEFLYKYWIIAPKSKGSEFKRCQELFANLMKLSYLKELFSPQNKMWQLGTTKVFMKEEVRTAIDQAYIKATHAYAVKIQKTVKGFLERRWFVKAKSSVKVIQRNLKAWFLKKKIHKRILSKKTLLSFLKVLGCRLKLKQLKKEAPSIPETPEIIETQKRLPHTRSQVLSEQDYIKSLKKEIRELKFKYEEECSESIYLQNQVEFLKGLVQDPNMLSEEEPTQDHKDQKIKELTTLLLEERIKNQELSKKLQSLPKEDSKQELSPNFIQTEIKKPGLEYSFNSNTSNPDEGKTEFKQLEKKTKKSLIKIITKGRKQNSSLKKELQKLKRQKKSSKERELEEELEKLYMDNKDLLKKKIELSSLLDEFLESISSTVLNFTEDSQPSTKLLNFLDSIKGIYSNLFELIKRKNLELEFYFNIREDSEIETIKHQEKLLLREIEAQIQNLSLN